MSGTAPTRAPTATEVSNTRSGFPRRDTTVIFVSGAVTAVLQTLLVREVFTAVAGNELVIGLMLAVWLAATAGGSAMVQRYAPLSLWNAVTLMSVAFAAGMIGIRAVRLLLLPGAALPPQILPLLLAIVEVPGAAAGGYIFGLLVQRGGGPALYAREQAGTLCGLALAALAIRLYVPNYGIAAGALLLCIPLVTCGVRRAVLAAIVVSLVVADRPTCAWKYPLPVHRICYTPEGETATVPLDGDTVTFVNGILYSVSYATPAIEQAVHAPLSMLPEPPRRVLLLNDAGHRAEIEKYEGTTVDCIRLDRVIDDRRCRPETIRELRRSRQTYNAVILGCPLPDNAADSRYFTLSFIRDMKALTGKNGVFSFTLPFNTEYSDAREERMRSIILGTLQSVFSHVNILPGEGFTFIASDAPYMLPDTCTVATSYFAPVTLASLTPERIAAVNRSPEATGLHTVAHPRLLVPVLDGYLSVFSIARWMFIALPLLLAGVLLTIVRGSKELLSVGSTGICTGIFSTGLVLMYQSVYGTVYSQLPLLLLAFSVGLVAGCYVRRFPYSDELIGLLLGGMLLLMVVVTSPPPAVFFLCNAVAGMAGSAQFVTRSTRRTGMLYAADCTGGVLGMALASTVVIPQFGLGMVAAGIAAVKFGTAIILGITGKKR